MSPRGRVDRIGGVLGHGPGPRVKCPACHGSGRVHEVDGPWFGWRLRSAMAEVARRLGVEGEDPGPEPVEELVPCSLCRGAGTVAATAAERWREQTETDFSATRADLMKVAHRLPAVEPATSAPTPLPTLRPVE